MAMPSIAEGEPRLAGLLARRAHIHLQKHLQTGQSEELDQAISTLQVAVHLAKSGPQRVQLGSMLNTLGVLCLRRYARDANEAVLDDTFHYFSWALECFPDDHPERVMALAGIAQMRTSRYDRTGAMLDLEEAITQMQTAIHTQRRFNDPDLLARILSNLGCVLWRRYQRTGRGESLQDAFTAMTKAAAAVSPDNAGLLGCIWTNLAGLLAREYKITGMLEHLGNAVFEAREVAHAVPESPELDSLLGVIGKLARCEYARRVPAAERTPSPSLSFYSGTLVLFIAVSLSMVSYTHSKILFYPIVFLVGMCCSGVTSQLYQKSREGSRLRRCLGYTRAELSDTPSEALPKIIDLPLFDDRLFETIQTESNLEKDAPGMEQPVNVVQTDDDTIIKREDVDGNNGNEYRARSTRHVLNKSSDTSFDDGEEDKLASRIENVAKSTRHALSKNSYPSFDDGEADQLGPRIENAAESTRHALNKSSHSSFHDGETDQVPQIEKQNPIITVSRPKPNEDTSYDKRNPSNGVEPGRPRNELEKSELQSTDLKSAQEKQSQTSDTAPAQVNIEQSPEGDTTKVVTEPKSDQTQERVHNVNVTGKISIDPSSYIAPEQPSNIPFPSGSSSMRPAGGGTQNTTKTENIPHAHAALRNTEKKEFGEKPRNFDLTNPMSQQNARGETQEPIAANQGNTTHDIHKNEGNAMGNLFSRRADVIGHISRHYGDKHEVNHYTVSQDSTNVTGAKIPTALSSQLPPSDSSSKPPSKAPILLPYSSLSPSDPLSKALIRLPQKEEEPYEELSRSEYPHKKNEDVSPNADKLSREKTPDDQESDWFPWKHVEDRPRPQISKMKNPPRRELADDASNYIVPLIYGKSKRRGDTDESASQASITPQAGWPEQQGSSGPRYKSGYSPSRLRARSKKPTRTRPFQETVVQHHTLKVIPKESFYRDGESESPAHSDNYDATWDNIRQRQEARHKNTPVSKQRQDKFDKAREYIERSKEVKPRERRVSRRRQPPPVHTQAREYIEPIYRTDWSKELKPPDRPDFMQRQGQPTPAPDYIERSKEGDRRE